MVYIGTYQRSLDEKGRLQIPPQLVGENDKTLYVLRGFDSCISVYPEEAFLEMVAKLKSIPFSDENNRAFIRLSAASAKKMTVDSHGRILLGKSTLDDYGFGKDVTLIGVLDHFEIWDPTVYGKYLLKNSLSFDNLIPGSF